MIIYKKIPKEIITIKPDLLNRIPKILHLYWDKSPMSKLQTLTAITFHDQNPDWEIRIYIPKQKYTGGLKYIPNYTGKDYFKLLGKLSYIKIIEVDLGDFGIREDLHNILRSDILRYHMLYYIGGVWSDFDVLWLKPLEDINNIKHPNIVSSIGVSVCFYKNVIGHHSIGILIARKKHLFYKELIDNVQNIQLNPDKQKLTTYNIKGKQFYHQSFGVVLWNKMYPKLSDFLNVYKDTLGVKYKTFYPYSIFNLDKLYNSNDISVLDDSVLCVHWFNGHPLSKEYINDRNYNHECAMTYLINLVNPEFYDNL